MIDRDDLPPTPDWMAQARPAIEQLEARWFTTFDIKPTPELCKQTLDGRGDQ